MTHENRLTLEELERKLRVAEAPFGMPSEAIAAAVARGEIEETPAFHEWSLLYTAWRHATASTEHDQEGLIEA